MYCQQMNINNDNVFIFNSHTDTHTQLMGQNNTTALNTATAYSLVSSAGRITNTSQ